LRAIACKTKDDHIFHIEAYAHFGIDGSRDPAGRLQFLLLCATSVGTIGCKTGTAHDAWMLSLFIAITATAAFAQLAFHYGRAVISRTS